MVNSSLVNTTSKRNDVHVHYVPANEEAMSCWNVKMANMVMLGSYLALTGIVQHASVITAFKKVFGTKANRILKQNREALKRGADYILKEIPLTAAI